jgi:multidrug efflux system membrane fusion protein
MTSDLPPPKGSSPVRGFRTWRHSRGFRPAVAGAIVLLVIVFLIRKHHAAKANKKGKGGAPTPVAAAAARQGDIPVYLDGLGSVTAFYTATVHSRVDGQLMSVNFQEGQYVAEGDVLAQIDPRPFQALMDQAAGKLASDQALLGNAKVDLERYRGLLALEAIPKQQFDTQTALVAQDEAAVKTDQAAVEAAELQVTYARIAAPISGRIGLRQVDPGNIVHASDANGLFIITQIHPITVISTLPEDNIPSVMQKLSAGASLKVLAYNRDRSQKLAVGKLLTIDNEIDPTTGTSKLKAVFDNKDNMLFPNQFVNTRLLLETKHDQVIIPAVAVQRGSQGTFVYIVMPDNTVSVSTVTVGITEGTDTAIESGVHAGDSVVVDGADKLQSGSKVTVSTPGGDAAAAGASKQDDHAGKHKPRHTS